MTLMSYDSGLGPMQIVSLIICYVVISMPEFFPDMHRVEPLLLLIIRSRLRRANGWRDRRENNVL